MFDDLLDMRKRRDGLSLLWAMTWTLVLCLGLALSASWNVNHHYSALLLYTWILVAIFGGSLLMIFAAQRLNDIGWNKLYLLLLVFPIAACWKLFQGISGEELLHGVAHIFTASGLTGTLEAVAQLLVHTILLSLVQRIIDIHQLAASFEMVALLALSALVLVPLLAAESRAAQTDAKAADAH